MDNADVTRYIVAQLRKYRNPNDVIEEVCEKTGMKWADAQEFVRRVQDEHVAEISGGQNTLLIGIRVAMVIGVRFISGDLFINFWWLGLITHPADTVSGECHLLCHRDSADNWRSQRIMEYGEAKEMSVRRWHPSRPSAFHF